jgi:hypothetical protein
MKKVFILLAFFSFKLLVTAQTPRNLLHRYSRDMVLQSLAAPGSWHPFPQSASEWRKILPDSVVAGLIRRGEAAVPFKALPATLWLEFVRTGNRENFEAQSFIKRNQLMDLVLAESVEGKGRFTDKILDGIWSICEETFWGLPAHVGMQKAGRGLPDANDPVVDLFAAETACVLAWADYLVGSSLARVSPLVHERIYSEVNRRIFIPIVGAKYEYMGYGNYNAKVNNWAPWIMSNYIAAALLLEKNINKRADAIMLAMKYTDQYLNGLGDDGAGDEGPLYWFAAGATAFDALTLLYDASGGKISLFGEPFIQKMGAYVYKTHIAGRYFINIADAIPEIDADGIMLYRFGKATGDEQMMHFGSWAAHHIDRTTGAGTERFFKSRILYNLAAAQECRAFSDKLPAVGPVWFPDIQLMTAHLSDGLFIATHGGDNGESHNHNDVGDVIIYADGEPVIIDAGAGTYTARTFSKDRYQLWFNTSAWHNLPTVNGVQQGAGRSYKARDVRFKSDRSGVRLSMDIAHAYDSSAGIISWVRDVTGGIKGGIGIRDVFNLRGSSNKVMQSFMTVCEADISTPGKVVFILSGGGKVYLDYDKRWKVVKERVELKEPEDEKIRKSWHDKAIWRIGFVGEGLGKEGKVEYKIYK